MIEIGKINTLDVVKEVDFGVYLDGGREGEILLPKKYIHEPLNPGDSIDVFIYLDSEDRLIGTTLTPLAMVNEFAFMEVVEVNNVGAFLEWGLEKHLFVPFREQRQKMEAGRSYIVHLYLDDESERIVATSKVDKFLNLFEHDYEEEQEVEIMICDKTDLGYKAIVNESHYGIIFQNEVFKPLTIGQQLKVFIKKVREDGKLDLALEKRGYDRITDFSDILLKRITDEGGFIPINDKSSPQQIQDMFGVSKKAFKQGVGALYKLRKIKIESDGIRLI